MQISNIGKKVRFTPEIVTVKHGKPVEAEIIAIGQAHLRVLLPDGSEQEVPTVQCEVVGDES